MWRTFMMAGVAGGETQINSAKKSLAHKRASEIHSPQI
jgi:hypothetical protein